MSEYNEALEWAAAWVENSVAHDDVERVKEFARNMAMSIRAAKVKVEPPTIDDVCHAYLTARAESNIESWVQKYPQFEVELREFAAMSAICEVLPERKYSAAEEAALVEKAQAVVKEVLERKSKA